MSVIMHGPYLKRTQLLCVIWQYHLWAACPCLSWITAALSLAWSSSTNMNLFIHVCKYEICLLNLNVQYMATRKHTHVSSNAVTLVWGSPGLTLINLLNAPLFSPHNIGIPMLLLGYVAKAVVYNMPLLQESLYSKTDITCAAVWSWSKHHK